MPWPLLIEAHGLDNKPSLQTNTEPSYVGQLPSIFNISRILVGNEIVDHLDVVGALPVGVAPTTSSFFT